MEWRSTSLLGRQEGQPMLSTSPIHRGFTLIELMITMAVLAIIVMVGLPTFQLTMQNLQVRAAAESILNGLELAKQEAVKRNALVNFNLTNAAGLADWNFVCNGPPFPGNCPNATPLQAYSSNEGALNVLVGVNALGVAAQAAYAVALPGGANMPASITFDQFGRVSTINPSFTRIDVTLTPAIAVAGVRRLVITIDPGGQIRLCDPQFALANNPQGCV